MTNRAVHQGQGWQHFKRRQRELRRVCDLCTCRSQSVQLVSDQHPRRLCQQAADAAVQQVAPHVRVHRRQRVVQQHHIRARVAGPCQRDALPLPAAQVDALLANLGAVTCATQASLQ